jgi:hypothetical protein
VSQNGQLLSRRGRSSPADASGVDTHCDSITSRFDCSAPSAASSWQQQSPWAAGRVQQAAAAEPPHADGHTEWRHAAAAADPAAAAATSLDRAQRQASAEAEAALAERQERSAGRFHLGIGPY